MQALLMHPNDNIAVAAADLPAGQAVEVAGEMILVTQPIPFGHKFARRSLLSGGIVFKYGQPVGRAVSDIAAGEHVHVHNIESLRGRGDLGQNASPMGVAGSAAAFKLKTADAGELSATHFLGYRRRDGRAGVRNHVLIMSTVGCSNSVVDRVGQMLPEVVALSHSWGCSQIGDDLTQSRRVLEEFATHPNVGAAILVGLGCETMPTVEMGEKLAAQGLPVVRLTIQEEGGTRATYARAMGIARELPAGGRSRAARADPAVRAHRRRGVRRFRRLVGHHGQPGGGRGERPGGARRRHGDPLGDDGVHRRRTYPGGARGSTRMWRAGSWRSPSAARRRLRVWASICAARSPRPATSRAA